MFNKIYGNILQFASIITGLGILINFFYCFFIINFFPNQLSIGETLLFIFSGLGFSTLYAFILSIFYAITYALFCNNSKNPIVYKLDKFFFLLLYLLPAVPVYIFNPKPETWFALFSFYISGYLLNIDNISSSNKKLFYSDNFLHQKKEQLFKKILILLSAILIPLVMSTLVATNLLKLTFSKLGIRTEHATVILDTKNITNLTKLSEEYDIPILNCKSGKYTGLNDVTVDWHGIGSISQISIKISDDDENIKIPLNSNGISIVRNINKQTKDPCILKQSSITFDSNSNIPNQLGEQEINNLILEISEVEKNSNLVPSIIYLKGYSDIQPTRNKKDSNFSLSSRRIEHVKLKLKAIAQKQTLFKTEALTFHKKHNSDICHSSQLSHYEKSCLSQHRVVDIIVQYVRKRPNK